MVQAIAYLSMIETLPIQSSGLTLVPTIMTVSSPLDHQVVWNLRGLLDPHDPTDFLEEYYGRKPLILRRDRPDYYATLLSLADVDELLSSTSIREPLIRVARSGTKVFLQGGRRRRYFEECAILDSLYAEYRNGASIILDFIHERWAPLTTLSRDLSVELSAGCQVNAYLTPPHSAALNPHYDSHDVFVLQAHGTKEWKIYENVYPLPLPGQE